MNSLTPQAVLEYTIRQAKTYDAAKKAGVSTAEYDFGVMPTCMRCGNMICPAATPMKCSACKAVIYCGKSCSRMDWTTPRAFGQPTHKELCGDYKKHMERLPAFREDFVSFPWAKLETDGTFNFDIARARFDVFGGTGTGFWSHCGGLAPHRHRGARAPGSAKTKLSPALEILRRELAHVDGADLFLHDRHLSDEEGWKLDPELIPYRDFAGLPEVRCPQMATAHPGGVVDWSSWYEWRRLPKASPAALLMTFPLSVYHMLMRVLGLTTPASGLPGDRVSLCVHLLGVEVELNYLPLFAELALLLPYHDITLVLFGSGVKSTVDAAARVKAVPGSPLQRALADGSPIFDYTAPRPLGSGTLKVLLHTASATWTQRGLDALKNATPELYPDALLALNAGLGAYHAWPEVLHAACSARIPCAVTEYTEASLEFAVRHTVRPSSRLTARRDADNLSNIQLPAVRPPDAVSVLDPTFAQDPAHTHAIAPNPFHRPGQRALPCVRLPNLVNGFTLCVVPHDVRVCDGCGACRRGRGDREAAAAGRGGVRGSMDDLD
ncbi:zinc finger MYND domain-containing protein [Phanerochaete sordida]|uniref:Zinc finger MYND domain-containing protein n=1 Tax=Phanerochaete sordida TaxID=48140 RepID=A0A9P3G8C5_9APHY|nr:zinc finger MYND domain-containing protein [Phanerochaete sordida]